MELNRKQIIKALENCSNFGNCGTDCPYFTNPHCPRELRKDALDLINKLTEENSNLDDTRACLKIELETERADTLNEFKNRLAQAIGTYTNKDYVYVYAWFKLIDQITNDMIGETK